MNFLLCRIILLTLYLSNTLLSPAKADRPAVEPNAQTTYTWHRTSAWYPSNSLFHRIPVPTGAVRVDLPVDSFGAWLRYLPLKAAGEPVFFFDGRLKPNQSVHEAVVDIDVGNRNLQQCADSIIRLRAEYLYSRKALNQIAFHYTSGHLIPFSKWSKGLRPVLSGPPKTSRWKVQWQQRSVPDQSRASFDSYLKNIFNYAGTMSLSRNLPKRYPNPPEVGDLYSRAGSGSHGHHSRQGVSSKLRRPHALGSRVYASPKSPCAKTLLPPIYLPGSRFRAMDDFIHRNIHSTLEIYSSSLPRNKRS